MAGHPALEMALDLKRNSALVRSMRHKPLPEGLIDLIKCAGGCTETCEGLALARQRSPEIIRDAAINFLLLVVFTPDATPERQLGLNPGETTRETVRLHKRWLVRWLHPDHNGDPWQTVLFNHVLNAALHIERRGMVTEKWQPMQNMQSQSWHRPMFSHVPRLNAGRSKSRRRSSHFSLYRLARIPTIFVLIALFGYLVIAMGNYLDSLNLLKAVAVQGPVLSSSDRVGLRGRVATDPVRNEGARQGDIVLLHERQ